MSYQKNVLVWAKKFDIEPEAKILLENGFDTLESMVELSEIDLIEVGFDKTTTRKKILSATKSIKDKAQQLIANGGSLSQLKNYAFSEEDYSKINSKSSGVKIAGPLKINVNLVKDMDIIKSGTLYFYIRSKVNDYVLTTNENAKIFIEHKNCGIYGAYQLWEYRRDNRGGYAIINKKINQALKYNRLQGGEVTLTDINEIGINVHCLWVENIIAKYPNEWFSFATFVNPKQRLKVGGNAPFANNSPIIVYESHDTDHEAWTLEPDKTTGTIIDLRFSNIQLDNTLGPSFGSDIVVNNTNSEKICSVIVSAQFEVTQEWRWSKTEPNPIGITFAVPIKAFDPITIGVSLPRSHIDPVIFNGIPISRTFEVDFIAPIAVDPNTKGLVEGIVKKIQISALFEATVRYRYGPFNDNFYDTTLKGNYISVTCNAFETNCKMP